MQLLGRLLVYFCIYEVVVPLTTKDGFAIRGVLSCGRKNAKSQSDEVSPCTVEESAQEPSIPVVHENIECTVGALEKLEATEASQLNQTAKEVKAPLALSDCFDISDDSGGEDSGRDPSPPQLPSRPTFLNLASFDSGSTIAKKKGTIFKQPTLVAEHPHQSAFRLEFGSWQRSLNNVISANDMEPNDRVSFFSDILLTKLSKLGIKVLAFDFDKTITSQHSGGISYTFTPSFKLLTESVTKDFLEFAREAENKGFRIAVVTFSDEHFVSEAEKKTLLGGERLVRHVLEKNQANITIEHVYGFFPTNWAEPSEYEKLGLKAPMPYDKSYHLLQVAKDYKVSLNEIILIDDDKVNCERAAKMGLLVLHVIGKDGFCLNNLRLI